MEHLFREGATALEELGQGCLPMARLEGEPPSDRLGDATLSSSEELLKAALAPYPLGLGGMETARRYRRSSGLGSNTENGSGLSSTVGSPNVDSSTIHATPVTDSSGGWPSAIAD